MPGKQIVLLMSEQSFSILCNVENCKIETGQIEFFLFTLNTTVLSVLLKKGPKKAVNLFQDLLLSVPLIVAIFVLNHKFHATGDYRETVKIPLRIELQVGQELIEQAGLIHICIREGQQIRNIPKILFAIVEHKICAEPLLYAIFVCVGNPCLCF